MLAELKYRFRKYIDPSDIQHDLVFLVAVAMVDPIYRRLLNGPQVQKAKTQLQQSLSENGTSGSNSPEADSPNSNADEVQPPPAKQFCHLSKVLERKLKKGVKKASKHPPDEQELEHYLHPTYTQEKDYPLLASLAVDILIIPGSSAPIECTFSTAGQSTSGKSNLLADKNLATVLSQLIRPLYQHFRFVCSNLFDSIWTNLHAERVGARKIRIF